MTITVLLFASYADALGGRSINVQLPEGSCVSDLVAALRALAGAGRLPARPLVAINERYVPFDTIVSPLDEVAVIPPVAGG